MLHGRREISWVPEKLSASQGQTFRTFSSYCDLCCEKQLRIAPKRPNTIREELCCTNDTCGSHVTRETLTNLSY
jgi:hypothetical protein